MNLLWMFNPGFNTPLQFYLTERLHASDAAYTNYLGTFFATFLPTMLLYGFLCTKMPARKLLWWSVMIGLPQMVPLAFVRSAHQALVMAVPMGLMGAWLWRYGDAPLWLTIPITLILMGAASYVVSRPNGAK